VRSIAPAVSIWRNTAFSMPERCALISILNGASGKASYKAFESGNLDALGSPRKGQTAVGAKTVAGVEILQLRNSLLSHGSCAIGRPVNDCVMNDDDVPSADACTSHSTTPPPMANPLRNTSIVSSGTTFAPPRWAKLTASHAESAASASHHPLP
jgi:hypothetical protein